MTLTIPKPLRWIIVLLGSLLFVLGMWALFLYLWGEIGMMLIVISGFSFPVWYITALELLNIDRWLE